MRGDIAVVLALVTGVACGGRESGDSSRAQGPATTGGAGGSGSGVSSVGVMGGAGGSGSGASSVGATGGAGGSGSGVSSVGAAAGAEAGNGSGTTTEAGDLPPADISDAAIQVTTSPAPPGLAGFAFAVDGVVQTPMTCPSDYWEFPPPAIFEGQAVCPAAAAFFGTPPCPGLTSAVLINTGKVPVAYYATNTWGSPGYVPGVLTGARYELAGVLDPGAQVEIGSVFVGGTSAVLGSSEPFSSPTTGKYASDEGSIPWPAGVSGSSGAAQMWLAQIDVTTSCGKITSEW